MTRRLLVALLLLGGLLVAPSPAVAAQGTLVVQTVSAKDEPLKRVQVRLFDRGWGYLGTKRTDREGVVRFAGRATGTYRVQVADSRPRWDVNAHAQVDATVKVRAHRTSMRRIVMRRGAFITGRVTTPKGAAKRAVVTATRADGGTFEVTADRQGRFALGGLPGGRYSVSARHGSWVGGRSTQVGLLRLGRGKDVEVRLRTRAGAYEGSLWLGDQLARGTVWVTAVHVRTGAWQVQRVRHGRIRLKGLAPGRYRLTVPGMFAPDGTGYLGTTITLRPSVRAGRTTTIDARLTRRGGRFTGTVVDAKDQPIGGATAMLFDRTGHLWHQVRTDRQGRFRVGGTTPTTSGMLVKVQSTSASTRKRLPKPIQRDDLRVVDGVTTDLGTLRAR